MIIAHQHFVQLRFGIENCALADNRKGDDASVAQRLQRSGRYVKHPASLRASQITFLLAEGGQIFCKETQRPLYCGDTVAKVV